MRCCARPLPFVVISSRKVYARVWYSYMIEFEDAVDVCDYKGKVEGVLQCHIQPCNVDGSLPSEDDDMFVEDPCVAVVGWCLTAMSCVHTSTPCCDAPMTHGTEYMPVPFAVSFLSSLQGGPAWSSCGCHCLHRARARF